MLALLKLGVRQRNRHHGRQDFPPDWSGGYTSLYALQQEEDWEV